LLGAAGFGAASLLAIAAPVLPLLVALRCAQAGCGALALVSAAALVRTSVPGRRRGRAFGAVGASATAAAAAGPALGGAGVHLLGWRGAFVVGLPLVALTLAVGARALPRDPRGQVEHRGFDLPGAVLLLAVLGGGAALLSQFSGWPLPAVLAAGGALAAVGWWFVRWELRSPYPVLDVRVFRVRAVVAAGAAVAASNAALYTVVLAVPLLVGSNRAIVLLVPLLAGASLASLLGGRLSDRWGRRPPALLGGLLIALPSLLLLTVDLARQPGAAAVLLGVCGIGQGMSTAAVQAAGLEALPAERAGLASGVWSTCRYLGSITGSSLLALLLADGTGVGAFTLAATGGVLSLAAAAGLPARQADRAS
jgi:DHA2 family methylenomycin A resistance protein-like MFS transporter